MLLAATSLSCCTLACALLPKPCSASAPAAQCRTPACCAVPLLVCPAAGLLPHLLSAVHLKVANPTCRSMWTAMP